jgi:hypothetical protein
MIRFGYKTEQGQLSASALVYQHSDGYPDGTNGVPMKLVQFFEAVEKDTNDTRFGNPEYLAAKWIVWATQRDREQSAKWREKLGPAFGTPGAKDGPLNFLGHGVSLIDHSDVEFLYFVEADRSGRPRVWWRSAYKVPKDAVDVIEMLGGQTYQLAKCDGTDGETKDEDEDEDESESAEASA